MDNRKTKILYILTKSGIGGAQKYVKDLAENLDAKKFEANVLYGGQDIKWLSNKTLPWFLFFNDWMAVFEIARILKRETPDIIHLNSSKAGFIGAISAAIANLKSSKKTKVVFTAHGWVFNPTNELSSPVRHFYIFLHWLAAKFQNKIICVSEYDYNLALKYNICAQNKLISIHNGINPNMKFLSKKEARNYIISRCESLAHNNLINKSWPWIGSIGRLSKQKNYKTFIEAANLISNAYFFILGSGPDLYKLKSKIEELDIIDRVIIISPTGNDSQYLRAFNIFSMSSIYEGLPYVLLEAMTAEVPIVVTETGGIPEIIQNHENGLMVAQKNPEALAHAIGGLIANPIIARDLSKKAKEAVIEKFNIKKMIDNTEKVYSNI